jgi:hypothetical protein
MEKHSTKGSALIDTSTDKYKRLFIWKMRDNNG